ncbi:MAG: hypothetical protein WAN36_03795, partial [Calditrichia bacterium]
VLAFATALRQSLLPFGISTIIKTAFGAPETFLQTTLIQHSIVLNMDLRSMEGMTLYAYLKNTKPYKQTTFTFLAEDESSFQLLKNIPMERAVILNKKDDYQQLIAGIINNLPLSGVLQKNTEYFLELSGKISDLAIRDILLYCSKTSFTGILLLNNKTDFALVHLRNGEPETMHYKDKPREKALELLRRWDNGHFRLERRRQTIQNVRFLLSGNPQTSENNGYLHQVHSRDLLTDILNFLYTFLSNQIPAYAVSEVFEKAIAGLNKKYTWISVSFNPFDVEAVQLPVEVTDDDLLKIMSSFEFIFKEILQLEPDINLRDFSDYIRELKPFIEMTSLPELLGKLPGNIAAIFSKDDVPENK